MSSRTLRSEQTIYVVSVVDKSKDIFKSLKAFRGVNDNEAGGKACVFAVQQMIQEYDDFVFEHKIEPIRYSKRETMCIREIEDDVKEKSNPLCWEDWVVVRDAVIRECDDARACEFMTRFVQSANEFCSVKAPVIKIERIGLA